MARVRVHQHVNPLAEFYQKLPVTPLDPAAVFETVDQPIHIDIGCGRGRFLLKMAEQKPSWNFLGLEIREPLVDEANRICADHDIRNLFYYFCNAPLDLGRLLEEIPAKDVQLITIQFPDPWFKKRHEKRRMVNKQLVSLIDENLADDGKVFVQTDVEVLSEDIRSHFEAVGFQSKAISDNPLQIKTEREVSVETRALEVFRWIYSR
jgi:tRNA (guanine-N7-)-methyltransferase